MLGSAVSNFLIRFLVHEPCTLDLRGRVDRWTTLIALSGPSGSIVSTVESEVSDVAVNVVLAPGEYVLQARAEVSSPAPERTYRLDATFGNDLVGVEGATWSAVKQLFR